MNAATSSFLPLVLLAVLCGGSRATPAKPTNPVVMRFYTAVFGYPLEREGSDGYEMARFPRHDDAPGASGALAKGDVYRPSTSGPLVYFGVADIDEIFRRAEANGGRKLYPKTAVGGQFVAEISDSEGNRIGLSADR